MISRKSMMVDGCGSFLDPINHLVESIDNTP